MFFEIAKRERDERKEMKMRRMMNDEDEECVYKEQTFHGHVIIECF